ncbi:PE family protein [Mycobacterium sp.]|uniref:PE family protein n=1 Tax=Mycobacterium sp. TaxID=1785 RepID=UPI003F9E4055
MEYLVTAPEILATTAADVGEIGSAITDANASAAGPTAALVSAAEDEVSEAIAKLFGGYGQQYQAVLTKAAAFHDEFARALAAAGNAYAQAEASTAALLTGGKPSALNALATSTVTGFANPSAQQVVALIMGGTWNPLPGPVYLGNVNLSYILPHFPGANPLAQLTPEQFWPVAGNETFGTSVAQGVSLLDSGIKAQLALGNKVVVFGYSQSATIATDEIRNLMALPANMRPDPTDLSFVLAGDPNNPDGGLLERFDGFYIPFLNVHFNGATPPNSPYPTSIYTIQYDGIADAPQYPLNVVSDLNAFLGYFVVHSNYPFLTPDQVAGAVHLATSPGYTGNTQYYMVMTQNLPLIQFIRDIPYAGPPIADIFQPDLRVIVDLGYGDIGPGGGYANLPTPASLLSVPNVGRVAVDLAKGAVQGPWSAVVDIVVESGYSPATSWYPDAYPYLPSPDPHLHIYLGQPSVTGLSRLASGLGSILELIPPFS